MHVGGHGGARGGHRHHSTAEGLERPRLRRPRHVQVKSPGHRWLNSMQRLTCTLRNDILHRTAVPVTLRPDTWSYHTVAPFTNTTTRIPLLQRARVRAYQGDDEHVDGM